MLAIKGIYTRDAGAIFAEPDAIPFQEDYEVIITFLKPLCGQEDDKSKENNFERQTKERREGYEQFMKYFRTLPPDFDYKAELSAYREKKYAHTN